jgi:putative hydrolase of the HAD superfamily
MNPVTPYRAELVDRMRQLSQPMQPLPTHLQATTSAVRCRGVLFDVYGTLFISGSGDVGVAAATDRQPALDEALAAAGLSGPCQAAHIRPLIEAKHARKRNAGILYPEVDILDIWRRLLKSVTPSQNQLERLAVEYEVRVNPTWPMPQLEAVLTQLADRHIPMGIVSNAQFYTPLLFPAHLNRSLETLGFDVEACVWSYQVGEAKPSPRLFDMALQTAATKWGLSPSEILYVGNDVRNDIWPAQLAGCRTALFAGDQRSLRQRQDDPELVGVAPDLVVTDLTGILPCLGL